MKEIPEYILGIARNSVSFSPMSVTIAQWAEETGWGGSVLVQKARNCFGIKYAEVVRHRVYQTNGFYSAGGYNYASYDTWDDCGRDRFRILQSMGARSLPCPLDEFVESFSHRWCPDSGEDSKAGYGARLLALIRTNDLQRYDAPATVPPVRATIGASPEVRTHSPDPVSILPTGTNTQSPDRTVNMNELVRKLIGNPVIIALAKRCFEQVQSTEGVKELEKNGIGKLQRAIDGVMEHPETVPVLKNLPSFVQRMVRDYVHHTIQDYVDALNFSQGKPTSQTP